MPKKDTYSSTIKIALLDCLRCVSHATLSFKSHSIANDLNITRFYSGFSGQLFEQNTFK